jgi:Formyl transferase
VPFIHIPATRDTRAEAEQRQLQLLSGNVDLVVLARYMQILTPAFLDGVGCPLINIHHSFLPAFVGASPYKRARERGVKLVGATAQPSRGHTSSARVKRCGAEPRERATASPGRNQIISPTANAVRGESLKQEPAGNREGLLLQPTQRVGSGGFIYPRLTTTADRPAGQLW